MTGAPSPDPTVTIPEAAALLGLADVTLYQHVRAGRLTVVPGSKPKRLYRQDVERYDAPFIPSSPPAPAETLTVEQAAAYTGLPPHLIHRAIRRGDIRPVLNATPQRVRCRDLDRLAAAEGCRPAPSGQHLNGDATRARAREALTKRRADEQAAYRRSTTHHVHSVYPCGPCYADDGKRRCTAACALVQEQQRRIPALPDTGPPVNVRLDDGYEHDGATHLYAQELERWPPLTPADVTALAAQRDAGIEAQRALRAPDVPPEQRPALERTATAGADARRQLFESNLRLVFHIAAGYGQRGVPLADLIQEGNLGLDIAVTKFNPHAGYRFSTYASWPIRQKLDRAIEGQSSGFRLPAHAAWHARKVRAAKADLQQAGIRVPSTAQIARHSGLNDQQLNLATFATRSVTSLERPLVPDGSNGTTLGDLVPATQPAPEDEAVSASLATEFAPLLATLTAREQDAIRLRFGLGQEGSATITMDEVGALLGMSRQGAAAAVDRALKKLRAHPALPSLVPYLTG